MMIRVRTATEANHANRYPLRNLHTVPDARQQAVNRAVHHGTITFNSIKLPVIFQPLRDVLGLVKRQRHPGRHPKITWASLVGRGGGRCKIFTNKLHHRHSLAIQGGLDQ